jgi:hypothetical protein
MYHLEWIPIPHNPWVLVDQDGSTYRKKPGTFEHYATVAAAQKVADKLNRQEAQDENISLV